METNQTPEEKLEVELMLKYCMRFRELYNDLLSNGYMGIFAKHQVLDIIKTEFLEENPDIDKKMICKIFFVIGDISNLLRQPKSDFDKTKNLDMGFEPTQVKITYADNDPNTK